MRENGWTRAGSRRSTTARRQAPEDAGPAIEGERRARLPAFAATARSLCRKSARGFAKAIKASGAKAIAPGGAARRRRGDLARRWRRRFHFRGRRRRGCIAETFTGVSESRSETRNDMVTSQIPNFSTCRFAGRVRAAASGRSREPGRRPRGSTSSRSTARAIAMGSICRANGRACRHICAGPIRRCTSISLGPCGNMPASRPPRSRTPSIAPISPRAKKACPSHSIWRRIAATIPIIRAWRATSGWRASRSIRSMTCARSSPAFRSIRSACR